MKYLIEDTGLINYSKFANELPAAEQAKTDNAVPAEPPVVKEPGTGNKNIKLAVTIFGVGLILSFFLGPFIFLLSTIICIFLTFTQTGKEGTKKSGIVKGIVIALGLVATVIIGIPLIFVLFCMFGGGF